MTGNWAYFAYFYRPGVVPGETTIYLEPYVVPNIVEVVYRGIVTEFEPVWPRRRPHYVEFEITEIDEPSFYQVSGG